MPSIQLIALTALCVHYSTLTILMHLSRTAQQTSTYRASSAVVMTELSKLIISFILALYDSFQQETQPTSRPSPHSRFEPQFDSLPEEDEEGDDLNPFVGSEQLEGIEMTDREIWRTEDSRRNEDSDHLISDMLSQLQSNPSNARERTISSEVYMPSQAGQRRRLISGNGTTSPDKPAFHLVPPISDHSHRMSVQASPQLTRPSQNHHSPSHSLSRLLEALGHLRTSVFSQDWLCLGIPAVMFVVQNNLQYLAASNLSVPLFQMTYQLKILTTALCSVLLLKRRLKKTQWASLIILATGVAIVQLSSQETSRTTEMEELSEGLKGGTEPMIRGNRSHKMNQLVGLMAVVSACLSSGFASVYLERLLKSTGTKTSTHSNSPELNKKRAALHPPSPASVHKPTLATPSTSIWIRNIQLSSFGLIVSILIVILENHIQDPIAFLSRAMRELSSAES
ncbi:hypothetical protein PCANC_27628 [Puccinia coronata f. sp. avenae]|uniref:UDP-galactose transporter n=1 Tax=Puccinia coronata f. sp. avenae TaxID=200324 RepID=A0A2N5RVQ4_9BASI|nr:hypothetical protein PCANC_27628 [Puccinia coronata f. sp. avenae]